MPPDIVVLTASAAFSAVLMVLYVRARRRSAVAQAERDQAVEQLTRPRKAAPARENSLGELLKVIHDPVILHGERIVIANPRFAALLGRDPEDLVGHHLSEFVLPEYSDLVADNVWRATRPRMSMKWRWLMRAEARTGWS